MTATANQRRLLTILDADAILVGIRDDLRAVITRIANRARTADEADDLRTLIGARSEIERVLPVIAGLHPDHRTPRTASDTAPGN